PRATEMRQDLTTGAIQYFNLLVVFVRDVHELLRPIARKSYIHSRPPSTRPHPAQRTGCVSCKRVLASLLERDRNILLKGTHPVEHLDPVGRPVTYIHVTILVHRHTMQYRHERFTSFGRRPVQFPLP